MHPVSQHAISYQCSLEQWYQLKAFRGGTEYPGQGPLDDVNIKYASSFHYPQILISIRKNGGIGKCTLNKDTFLTVQVYIS